MPDVDQRAQQLLATLVGQQALQIVSLTAQLEAVISERDALAAKQKPAKPAQS